MLGKLANASRVLLVRAAALRRAVPISPAGVAVLSISVAAAWLGTRRQDLVLTLAGAWGIVLAISTGWLALTCCFLLRQLMRRRLAANDTERARLDLVERMAAETGFGVPARSWPLLARPSWRWVDPEADTILRAPNGELVEKVSARCRFLRESVSRELEVSDVFGLWRIRTRVEDARPARSLPDVGMLQAAALDRTLSPSDDVAHPFGPPRGDRADFRSYGPSDPARLILWKAFARTRELLLRVPEPARTPERRPLVYLVAGAGDDAAAAAARVTTEASSPGHGLLFAADGRPRPTEELDAALDAIAGSVEHRHRGGRDLAAALASPEVGASDPVIAFCPAAFGSWLPILERMTAREPERFVVVLCCDELSSKTSTPAWTKLLYRPGAPRGAGAPTEKESIRLAQRVAATGASVLLAERSSGRVLDLSSDIPWALAS